MYLVWDCFIGDEAAVLERNSVNYGPCIINEGSIKINEKSN